MKKILSFFALWILTGIVSSRAWGDDPLYHCYHMPNGNNWKFEAGKMNCDLDKSGKATLQDICLETVTCIFITPDVKATLEKEAKEHEAAIKEFMGPTASQNIPYSTKIENMSSDLIPFIMGYHVTQLHGEDYSHPSTLVCKYSAQDKRCQTIKECQGPLLFSMTQEGLPMGQTEYLKQSGDEFTPVRNVK